MTDLTMKQFRIRYQRLLDPAPRPRFKIKAESNDAWIVVTSGALSFIHVGHKLNLNAVDLALFDKNFGWVGDAVPPDAIDISTPKTNQFRWLVSQVDPTKEPSSQAGVGEAIERIKWAFGWVRENRVS